MGEKLLIVVQEVARFELRAIGIEPQQDDIDAFSPQVNAQTLSPILNFIQSRPNTSVAEAVELLAPVLRSRWLSPSTLVGDVSPILVPTAKPKLQSLTVSELTPTVNSASPSEKLCRQNVPPVEPSLDEQEVLQEQVKAIEEQDEVDAVHRGPDSKITALYPNRPPRNVDLHSRLMIGNALFRTMPRAIIHHQALRPNLDSSRVIPLDSNILPGYQAMLMSGPVLDSDNDLKTYICLMSILGNLSDSEYNTACLSEIRMQPHEFYAPLVPTLPPDEVYEFGQNLMSSKRMAMSLTRIKEILFTVYEYQEDIENVNSDRQRKGEMLLVSLVGSLAWESDGSIRVTPTPQLRELYRSTSKLIPINRNSVLHFKHSLTRVLSLWVASIGRRFNKATQWVEIGISMSVRSLLEAVHPISGGKRYRSSDVSMLADALLELHKAGMLDFEIEYSKAGNADPDNPLRLVSTKAKVVLKRHRLSHKARSVEKEGLSDKDAAKEMPALVQGRSLSLPTTAAMIVSEIPFPRGKSIQVLSIESKWYKDNIYLLMELAELTRVLAEQSLELAVKSFQGVNSKRRVSLQRIFELVMSQEDSEILRQVLSHNSRSLSRDTSRSVQILMSLPLSSKIGDIKLWQKQYLGIIQSLMELVRKDHGEMGQLARVNHLALGSRLIAPLIKSGREADAEFFRSLRLFSNR